MTITKYRVYFDVDDKEKGYIEYTSSEGLEQYEIITEEVQDES